MKDSVALKRQELVLAAMIDSDGNPCPWYAAEEIGYAPSLKYLTLRQIVGALNALRNKGLVRHSGGVEWTITEAGLAATRTGLK